MSNTRTIRKRTRTSVRVLNEPQRVVERYAIKPVKGRPLRTDLDKVAEVIAEIEGDDYR